MTDVSTIIPISVFESPDSQASLAGLVLNYLSPPALKHIQTPNLLLLLGSRETKSLSSIPNKGKGGMYYINLVFPLACDNNSYAANYGNLGWVFYDFRIF